MWKTHFIHEVNDTCDRKTDVIAAAKCLWVAKQGLQEVDELLVLLHNDSCRICELAYLHGFWCGNKATRPAVLVPNSDADWSPLRAILIEKGWNRLRNILDINNDHLENFLEKSAPSRFHKGPAQRCSLWIHDWAVYHCLHPKRSRSVESPRN